MLGFGRINVLVFLALVLGWWVSPVAAATGADAARAWNPSPRTWLVFASAECEECEWLKMEFLPDLEERFHTHLPTVAFIDIDDLDNYALLNEAEAALHTRSGEEFPAFLVGSTFHYGREAIAAWGETLTDTLPADTLSDPILAIAARAKNVVFYGDLFRRTDSTAKNTAPTTKPVPVVSQPDSDRGGEVESYREARVIYFETTGCKKCARAEKQLAFALSKIQHCPVYRVNAMKPDGRALQYAMTSRLNLPAGKRLITPMFLSDTHALYGKAITDAALQKLLRQAGSNPFWKTWDETAELTAARRYIRGMAAGFTIPAMIGAGLIDGINPCAFAVIIFLVSYLTLTGRLGRKFALIYGLTFAAGVFTCYVLIGLGFFQLLDVLESWKSAMRWVFLLMGIVCVGFGISGVIDTVAAYRGGAAKMKFGMPKSLHRVVHRLIREDVSRGALGIGAFLIGVAVSGVELVCTGQIYLPAIVFINTTAPGIKSVGLLLIYNVAFILPLIIVVILGTSGLGSQKLSDWARRNAALTRALTTALVFGLAIAMFVMAWKA